MNWIFFAGPASIRLREVDCKFFSSIRYHGPSSSIKCHVYHLIGGRRHTRVVCNESREPHTSHYPSRPTLSTVNRATAFCPCFSKFRPLFAALYLPPFILKFAPYLPFIGMRLKTRIYRKSRLIMCNAKLILDICNIKIAILGWYLVEFAKYSLHVCRRSERGSYLRKHA